MIMEVLFARSEHGGHKVVPVKLTPHQKVRGLEVWWPEGPVKYTTNRQALIAIVNKTPAPGPGLRDPKTTFDRYFRRGKYQRETYPEMDVLSIFRPDETLALPPVQIPLSREASDLAILPNPQNAPKRNLGIDLERRGHEVRKLFYAGFARRVAARGYDPEDVLQELYKALLIRNRGKCPWDPQKSSFGHYVHMVAGCIISNYNRKFGRLEAHEVFGISNAKGEVIDVAEADAAHVSPLQEDYTGYNKARNEILGLVLMEAPNRGIPQKLAQEVFLLAADGAKIRDLKKDLSEPLAQVQEALRLVQDIARLWRTSAAF